MLTQSKTNAYNLYQNLKAGVPAVVFGQASLGTLLEVQKQSDDLRLQKKALKEAKKENKKLKKAIKRHSPLAMSSNPLRQEALQVAETSAADPSIVYRIEKDGSKTPVDSGFLRGFLGAETQVQPSSPSREVLLEVIDHSKSDEPTVTAAVDLIIGSTVIDPDQSTEDSLREPQTSLRDELIPASVESNANLSALAIALANPIDGKKNQKHNRRHYSKKDGHESGDK